MRILLFILAIAQICLAEPLTLKQAALETLQNHPELEVAAYSVEVEQAVLKQRQGPFYPTVAANANYFRVETDQDNTFLSSVNGTQILADFGKRKNRSRQQEARVEATRIRQQFTLQSLLSQVALAYLSLNRDQQLLRVQESNVRWATLRLKEAQTRGLDRSLALSDLSAARLSLLNSVNALKISRVALGNAMGRGQVCSEEVTVALLEMPEWDYDQVRELAFQSRPDLQALRMDVSASKYGVGAAKSEYRPTIAAVTDYGQLSGPTDTIWKVGLQMSFPIFNEPVLSGAVEQSEAEFNRQLARVESLELQVSGQANSALVNAQQTRLQVHQNQVSVMRAWHTFIETWTLARLGHGNSRDLSNAQRDLVAGQSALVATSFAHQQALVRLYADTGQLDLAVLPNRQVSYSSTINRYLSPTYRGLPNPPAPE